MMPLSSAEGENPGSPSAEVAPLVVPSDAEISAACEQVRELAHRHHEERGRTVGLS